MTSTLALAAAATLVALAFAGSTFERWLARRRPQELAWTVALILFAAGSGALWTGATLGWGPVTFRLFYLFGAVLNVPALALGTIYLLGGRRRGHVATAAVTIVGAFAAGVLCVAPLTGPIDPEVLPQGSDVFGPLPRVLAASASGLGAAVVLGGAVWSAVQRRREPRLVAANVLIALGTVVLSASGLLNSVLGEMEAFSVTLTAGVSLLFAGAQVASTTPGARRSGVAGTTGAAQVEGAAPVRRERSGSMPNVRQ